MTRSQPTQDKDVTTGCFRIPHGFICGGRRIVLPEERVAPKSIARIKAARRKKATR